MLAKDVLTEEWLADVLQDSLEMDWTTTDGARAIMRALEAGLMQLPQTGGQIAALATTPPTTNDAIPAGMVRWDGGDSGDSAPADWDPKGKVMFRDGEIIDCEKDGEPYWDHVWGDADIIAYTPKASAAPSAPATEAGEEA